MTPAKVVLAILFADVCDSVRLYDTLGDDKAQPMITACMGQMIACTEANGGRLLGTRGDGVIASFATADAALAAALGLLKPPGGPLAMRVGCSLGPVIKVGGDVYGDAANIAARLLTLGRPGEILLSDEMVQHLSEAAQARTRLVGELEVKGKARPVRVYCVVRDADPQQTQLSTTPPPSAALHLRLSCAGRTLHLRLQGPPLVVGREEGCDLIVAGPLVSRRHAVIQPSHGKFSLIDQSTNGTFVSSDGRTVFLKRETLTLPTAGTISLGQTPDVVGAATIGFRHKTG